jgi:hypothetical protein
MLISLDAVSRAIVDVIRMNGYTVDVAQHGEMYHAVATRADCERLVAKGPDLYLTICAPAEEIGIELEDG